MLKILLFVAIATVQCSEIRGKLNEDPAAKATQPEQQGQGVDHFRPRGDWSYFHPSWSLSSMSHFFKDDDDVTEPPSESQKILQRLTAVERMIKELNDLLQKESDGRKKLESTPAPSNKVEPLPCKESPPKTTTDQKPQKDGELPQKDADQPQKTSTEASEMVDKPTKTTQTTEKIDKLDQPSKTKDTMKGENSPKDSVPVTEGEPSAPSMAEEKENPRENNPRKKRV